MVTPADFAVVVQTIPERHEACAATLASLAQSDVPGCLVVTQQPQESKLDNLMHALKALRRSGKPYGIRFEDDVIVNKHILHNVARWSALDEPDFGAGWLFHSFLLAVERTNVQTTAHGNSFRATDLTVGSLGVVFPTKLLDEHFIREAVPLMYEFPGVDGAQDKTISKAMYLRQRHVYLHEPPLVEHNIKFPSSQAPDREVNPELHTTNGMFDIDWKST